MPALLNLIFSISFFLGSCNLSFSHLFLILNYTEINSQCFPVDFLVKDQLILVKFF